MSLYDSVLASQIVLEKQHVVQIGAKGSELVNVGRHAGNAVKATLPGGYVVGDDGLRVPKVAQLGADEPHLEACVVRVGYCGVSCGLGGIRPAEEAVQRSVPFPVDLARFGDFPHQS